MARETARQQKVMRAHEKIVESEDRKLANACSKRRRIAGKQRPNGDTNESSVPPAAAGTIPPAAADVTDLQAPAALLMTATQVASDAEHVVDVDLNPRADPFDLYRDECSLCLNWWKNGVKNGVKNLFRPISILFE